MREDVPLKKLGDVCNIIGGGTPSKKREDYYSGDIPWATVRDMNFDILIDTDHKITQLGLDNSSANIIPKDNVVIATRVGLGKVCKLRQDTAINQDLKGIIPKNDILITDYLYLWFKSISDKIVDAGTGATVQGVKIPFVKNLQIPIPPLPEQKRIVAILDEAFESIDRAKANVEKNIQNAEELFQSKLNDIFLQKGEGWLTEKLSNVFKMKSGDQLSKKNIVPGPYPVYGGNGVTAHHHDFNLEGQQLLIGRVGAQCGNIHLTSDKIWLTDNAFRITDLKYDFDFEFLEHLLRVNDLRQTARQTAQPVISNSSCKNVQLIFPESIAKQKEIAELVNSLDTEVLQIITTYISKLKALKELKKSILHKAFTGELTAKETVAA